MHLFEKHIQWPLVKELCETLKKRGFKAYLAGGCVRDALLDRPTNDFDIATDATPEQVQKIFEKTLQVGAAFGVIVVILEGHQFEVATFRGESDYKNGRHPEKVYYSDEKEDARRRDFTINALFYDPFTGKLIDYCHGQKDLENKILRCVGRAQDRFEEDRLRILRLFRFVAQLDFAVDEDTLKASYNYRNKLDVLSRERISTEFFKLTESKNSLKGLYWFKQLGLFSFIFGPEVGVQLENSSLLEEWFFYTKEGLQKDPGISDPSTLSLFLIYSLVSDSLWESGQVESSLRGLCVSKKQIKKIFKMRAASKILLTSQNKGELVEALLEENALGLLRLGELFSTLYPYENNQKIEEALNVCAQWIGKGIPQPIIGGSELKSLGGFAPHQFAEVIKKSWWAQLEGKFKDSEGALNWLKEQNIS